MDQQVKDARRIQPRELKDLMTRGGITLLDMRRDWDTSDRMIPGAIRVDPDAYKEYEASLPRGRTVVTYCT